MATTATSTSKVCVSCGRDVNGAQRMRDSQGKYWCIACGEADKRKKKGSDGVVCAGCSKNFLPSQMTAVNLLPYCTKCAKRRKKASRSSESIFSRLSASSDQIDKKRMVIMLAFMGLLAVVAIAVHVLLVNDVTFARAATRKHNQADHRSRQSTASPPICAC